MLFGVGEAGSVIVRSDGTEVSVVEVVTSEGWDHRIAREVGSSVNVVFVAAAVGIDFRAALEESSIVGRIRIVTPPAGVPPAPSADAAAVLDQLDRGLETADVADATSAPPLRPQGSPAEEPAAPNPVTTPPGPEGLGLAYGKIDDSVPIVDPVLDARTSG
jgi:hypothetical protein